MTDEKFDIPKGRDPGEFLTDADLAIYWQRRADDPKDPTTQVAAIQSKRSALATELSIDPDYRAAVEKQILAEQVETRLTEARRLVAEADKKKK